MTTQEIMFYNEFDNNIHGDPHDPDHYETYQRLLDKYNQFDEFECLWLFDIDYLAEKGIYHY